MPNNDDDDDDDDVAIHLQRICTLQTNHIISSTINNK